ncbi:hypothetical protein ACOMHN_008194 [Nucella lapillus]
MTNDVTDTVSKQQADSATAGRKHEKEGGRCKGDPPLFFSQESSNARGQQAERRYGNSLSDSQDTHGAHEPRDDDTGGYGDSPSCSSQGSHRGSSARGPRGQCNERRGHDGD